MENFLSYIIFCWFFATIAHQQIIFVPHLSWKRGTLKLIHPSFCLCVCPSVTKSLTLLISSEVLMIEHWYLGRYIAIVADTA